MYIPSESLSEGRNPFTNNSTIVTNEATITINAGILTLSGMIFLSADIIKFDITRTAVVERPIPSPLNAEVVTASVGHIPSIKTRVGFSFTSPLYRRSVHLFTLKILLP